jgi:hypothetical protein
MPAALLFQSISLLVSVGLVPVLLRFLGTEEYLAWALFTTIGGYALQAESAIQTVMVRRVATASLRRDANLVRFELANAQRAYNWLAATICFGMLPVGWLYFDGAVFGSDLHTAPEEWRQAWFVFCSAYALNFLFGPNNVRLLASGKTNGYFLAGSATRLLNFVVASAAMALGFALPAVAAAFAAAVITNVVVVAFLAKRSLGTHSTLRALTESAADSERLSLWSMLGPYFLFCVAAYCIYRGGFLVATPMLDTFSAGGYGLALQTIAIVQAIAGIPLTVRLQVMVHAIERGDVESQDRETCIALLFAGLSVLAGMSALVVAGPVVLEFLQSTVALPATGVLFAMGIGISIECAFAVLTSRMILSKNYGFVRPYVTSVLMSAVLAVAIAWWTGAILVALLAGPILAQSVWAAPRIMQCFGTTSGRTTKQLLRDWALTLRRLLSR